MQTSQQGQKAGDWLLGDVGREEQKVEIAKGPKETCQGDGCVYYVDGGDDSMCIYGYLNSPNGTLHMGEA